MKFAAMSPASFARESGCMASFNDRQYKFRSNPEYGHFTTTVFNFKSFDKQIIRLSSAEVFAVPHKASVRSGSLRLLQNSLSLDYYLSLASLLFTDSKYWFRYAPMRMIYIQKYIHSSTMMIMERLP